MLSIIIPACNEEKYIEETLKSIKSQDYKDYEIVVVCNGCNDRTGKVANKYTKKVYYLKEGNIVKARNYGAKKAKGEILIFLDADTKFKENNILKNIVNNNINLGTCRFMPDKGDLKFVGFAKLKNLSTTIFGGSNGNMIISKDIFNKINGYDNNKTPRENYHLVKKAKRYTKFKVLNHYVITSMRRHNNLGYIKLLVFWLKFLFSKNKTEYGIIR